MLIETRAGLIEVSWSGGKVLANGARPCYTMQTLAKGLRAVAVYGAWKDAPGVPLVAYKFRDGDEEGREAAVRKAREDWAPLGL